MQKRIVQPLVRMLSEPRIWSAMQQQRDGDRRVGEPSEGAGELRDDPASQPVATEADCRNDADRRQAADDVGAESWSHERGMLIAAPGVRI